MELSGTWFAAQSRGLPASLQNGEQETDVVVLKPLRFGIVCYVALPQGLMTNAGDHKPQIYEIPVPLGGIIQSCNFDVPITDSSESII